MPATATIRIGQVWAAFDGSLALITAHTDGSAYLRYVTGNRLGESEWMPTTAITGGWGFRSENARLRCLNHDTALTAARFLTGQNVGDVLVDGDTVSAPLTVMSVMNFAEDALEHGWARDDDCARMIGDLG